MNIARLDLDLAVQLRGEVKGKLATLNLSGRPAGMIGWPNLERLIARRRFYARPSKANRT